MIPLEAEIEFIDKIDCNFPYGNKAECLALIDESINISSNSVFTVVEELCRVPVSEKEKVSNAFLLYLLNIISDKFNHPLKDIIFRIAQTMIEEREISVTEALSTMEIIKKYPGEYAALSIVYFSCDDKEQQIEEPYRHIVTEWANQFSGFKK